jgi:hypothetical protein
MAVLYFGNVENQSWRKPGGNAFDIPHRPDRTRAYPHQRGARSVHFLPAARLLLQVDLFIHSLSSRKRGPKYSVSGFLRLPTFSLHSGRKKREAESVRAESPGSAEATAPGLLLTLAREPLGITRHRMKTVARLQKLNRREAESRASRRRDSIGTPPPRYSPKIKNEPEKCFRINKSAQKRTRERTRTNPSRQSAAKAKAFRISDAFRRGFRQNAKRT